MKIIRKPESFSIDDKELATLMVKILTPLFSELHMTVKAEIQDVLDKVTAVQSTVTALHDSVETLKTQNGALVTLTGTLKSLLDQSLANSTLSAEDKAALTAAGDSAVAEATAITAETSAVGGVSQADADTVATKQPGN